MEVRITMGHYWCVCREAEIGLLKQTHLSMLFYKPEIINQYSGLQIRASNSNYTTKSSRSEVGIQSAGQDILLILWNPNKAHQSPSSVPVVGGVSSVHSRQTLCLKSILLIPLKKYFLESEVKLRWTVLVNGGNTSFCFVTHVTKIQSLCVCVCVCVCVCARARARVEEIQSDI